MADAEPEHPFPDLKIDSSDFLDDIVGRTPCPKCQKSRKYYCYTCYVPVPALEGKLPRVKLPIKVDIIKHPGEVDGKSTAAHAAVLAAEDVTVYTYPSIPDYTETDRVVLVFPCEESLTIEQYAEQCCRLEKSSTTNTTHASQPGDVKTDKDTKVSKTAEGTESEASQPKSSFSKTTEVQHQEPSEHSSDSEKRKSLDNDGESSTNVKRLKAVQRPEQGLLRVVFIDSTWFQVRKIYTDERLRNLKKVELKTQTTKFWRPQGNKPNTYLATIEAIYFFLREYHLHFVDADYRGQYDNLLFLFTHLYRKVQQAEKEDPSKKKKFRKV